MTDKDLQEKLTALKFSLEGECTKKYNTAVNCHVKGINPPSYLSKTWLYILHGPDIMQQAFLVYQTHKGEIYWEEWRGGFQRGMEKEIKCEERRL